MEEKYLRESQFSAFLAAVVGDKLLHSVFSPYLFDSEQQPNPVEVMAAEGDSIGESAEARRERLKALRRAQELFDTPDEDGSQAKDQTNNGEDDTNDESLNMKFRNYLPQDKELQEGRLAPPDLPKFEDPVAPAPPSEKKEDPFLNIAPKKPNWDLRRDVQKKLDKLERRTQKALFKLMEEQEKQQQSENGETATEED